MDDNIRDRVCLVAGPGQHIKDGKVYFDAVCEEGEPTFKVHRSISHCGHCGQPTLEHDDERCRAAIDDKCARAILHNLNALAGQFEAKRLIGIKQLVDELWAQSATWPRTPWWLRMWDRVRSWF